MARNATTQFPLATGEAGAFLNRTEPQLAEAVRRGLISPAPPVRAGRRLWDRTHILQAADALGVDLADDVRMLLAEENARGA